jgi:hypothetical protein
MRYIVIPSDVTILGQDGKAATNPDGTAVVVTFRQFLDRLQMNPMWTASYAAIKSASAVDIAYNTRLDATMVIDQADWERLKAAVESPSTGPQQTGLAYPTFVALQILPFMAAIVDAQEKPPEPTR